MKLKGRHNYKAGRRDEAGSPPYAVVPLLNLIEWHRKSLGLTRKEFVIWEPATQGIEGRIHLGLVKGFQSVGYPVFAPRGIDFLETEFEEVNQVAIDNLGHSIKMIATNPPFSVGLKRAFIRKCDEYHEDNGLIYSLLMNTTTIAEKVNGWVLRQCAIHIPYGRICFNMPDKGWGTEENPTKATFTTNWFSKGLTDPYTIHYDLYDMSDHFHALRKFDEYCETFISCAEWLDFDIEKGLWRDD